MKLILENWRKYIKESKEFEKTDDYYKIGDSSAEYNPAWDYDPNEDPDLLSMEAYELAFPVAQQLARKLGMGDLALYFIAGDSVENHVARYINGTYSSPIVVLSDKVTEQSEAVLTLFHELGHAYVESTGVELDLDEEEKIVEDFAHTAYNDGPEHALQFLDKSIGEVQ